MCPENWGKPTVSSGTNIVWTGSVDNGYNFSGTLLSGGETLSVSGQLAGTLSASNSNTSTESMTGQLALSNLLVKSKAGKTLYQLDQLVIDATKQFKVSGGNTTQLKLNGNVIAFDRAANSSKKLTLKLSNFEVTADNNGVSQQGVSGFNGCKATVAGDVEWTSNQVTPKLNGSSTLAGAITLDADDGDQLSGTIRVQMKTWNELTQWTNRYVWNGNTCTNNFWYAYDTDYLDNLEINLSAKGGNKSLVAMTLTGSSGGRLPAEDKPISATNFTSEAASATLVLVSNTEIGLTYAHNSWDTLVGTGRVKSGGSEIKVETTYKAVSGAPDTAVQDCKTNKGVEFCTSAMTVSSADGSYRAQIIKSGGQINGVIYKGGSGADSQVGEIRNGVLYANGKQMSLY